jgi:hypothetical protein
MSRLGSKDKEWSDGDSNMNNMYCQESPSTPRIKSLLYFGKSKSLPAATKQEIGPEDDRIIAKRLAQLCLSKYPSLSAIPPPTKYEKHTPPCGFQRSYSAPNHIGAPRDEVGCSVVVVSGLPVIS